MYVKMKGGVEVNYLSAFQCKCHQNHCALLEYFYFETTAFISEKLPEKRSSLSPGSCQRPRTLDSAPSALLGGLGEQGGAISFQCSSWIIC